MKIETNDKNIIAKNRLELAKKYLQNSKDMLAKAGVDKEHGRYDNIKYVSSASGIAYLSSLEALKSLFFVKNLIDEKDVKSKLKDYSVYTSKIKELTMIGKDRDSILKYFVDVYDLLHIGGYYRELQNKKAIDSGFEQVEKIIAIVEKYIKHNGVVVKKEVNKR
jgi:HEPN domain-containing protein